MAKIGYVRVSSKEQNLARQIELMSKNDIDERFIFTDKSSGANFERDGYKAMKRVLRAGDVLFIENLDRLGRDYNGILEEWRDIRNQGVHIVALDNQELFDSRKFEAMGDIGKLLENQMLNIFAYVSEQERTKMLRRQKEGIETARKAGVKFGRPTSVSDWNLFDQTAKRWAAGEITAAEACRITGCKKTSWYKYTKERGFPNAPNKTQNQLNQLSEFY